MPFSALHHTQPSFRHERQVARSIASRPAHGGALRARAWAARISAASDYEMLSAHTVFPAAGGAPVNLTSLWKAEPSLMLSSQPAGSAVSAAANSKTVVAFFTHFADLSSTEFAQKLLPVLPQLQTAGVKLLAVGLGEPDKARKFSQLLGFPEELLYADPTGELYTALGFNPGFAPESNFSAYAKLLVMLAGVGSPGTIPEVLRGYVGDRSAKPVFSGSSNLFDVLGQDYQRPFELATLRLFNMNLVLSNWAALAPSNERLLTQQGGCIGFDGAATVFRHADTGILKYANVDQMLAAMVPRASAAAVPPGSQVLRTFL